MMSRCGWSGTLARQRLEKKSMKLVGSVATIAAIGLLTPSLRQVPVMAGQAWGEPNGGLRIGIAAVNRDSASSADLQFEVALENTGAADFVLNLGHMLANGKVMFPSSVRLVLTDPSGQTRDLEYFDRKYPGVAGRVDDFTVALRVGSVYTIRTTMDHYWSPSTKEFGVTLVRGRYRILARFQGEGARTTNSDMPGVALMNFWKGTVQSNPFEFVVPGKAALD
jgi:hypothetical protein